MFFDDKNLTFHMYPLSNNDAGLYFIQVSLSDSLGVPTDYTFKLTVISIPEPIMPPEKVIKNEKPLIPTRVERTNSTKK